MANPQLMQQGPQRHMVNWFVRNRWALVPTITGMAIVAFVILTGGEHGAWLLWIAIPMLILGLGYFFLINAVKYFVD